LSGRENVLSKAEYRTDVLSALACESETRSGGNNDRLEYYQADFSSLDEARRLVGAIGAKHDRLELLINNAGIGSTTRGKVEREASRDGHESRFAVNYLAPFLLTHLLLPLIRNSAPARIVNVASAGQQRIDFSDVMLSAATTACAPTVRASSRW
jgi:NAD(P)-dependent dehydrogenase (short-subunit alcohol dehydrogenase family)